MKKNRLIMVVVGLVLLLASTVFNYNLNNKLKAAISLSETLVVELQESNVDNEALKIEVSSLVEDLDGLKKELQSKTETIALIDGKLEADGTIIERIDEIITENTKLRKDLNTTFLELNILEEENSKETEGVMITDIQIDQWDTEIKDIQKLLKSRIAEMEEIISNLSPLSMERIMIKQEMDLLEKIYVNAEKLKNVF